MRGVEIIFTTYAYVKANQFSRGQPRAALFATINSVSMDGGKNFLVNSFGGSLQGLFTRPSAHGACINCAHFIAVE